MANVRTLYELREFTRIVGHADFVALSRFDELEENVAKASYRKAANRAEPIIGTTQTLVTSDHNEATGKVDRILIELVSYKTSEGRSWDHRVVGSTPDDSSHELRTVLEAAAERGEPQKAPEKDESPAEDGAPAQV